MQKLDKRNYIHTFEFFARSSLCGSVLKVPKGKDGVLDLKTFSNNLDAGLTSIRGEEKILC